MRAEEFVTEIIKIPADQFELDQSDMPSFNYFASKSKPLPGGSGLIYAVKGAGSASIDILIGDPTTKKTVGYLTLSKSNFFPLPNAYYVDSIIVDPARRGQGIAKALYGIYLSILKYPLLAGSDQTPGGRRNWLSLASIPGVEVRGYTAFGDEYFDHDRTRPGYIEKKFKQLIDNLMNMGGEYLGNKQGRHYFVFDVEPGSGELEPAVKNQLKLYGYHDITTPGLYAVWIGQ